MKPRILVVEDEPAIADTIVYALATDGFEPDWCGTGADALKAVRQRGPALAILDIGLPDTSGFDLFRQLRELDPALPAIFLTARSSEVDRVVGLELGADDYMAKPFSLQELEARVRALTRRGLGTASNLIRHGPLSFDATGRVAYINDQMVELSARELSLLEVLLQRAGRLVSKDQLVERLCEWGEEVSNNAIEVYIHRLRKKIEQGPIRIATVRGLGYCLDKIVA